jgi:tetraprenyl-beta-curcumene synthase
MTILATNRFRLMTVFAGGLLRYWLTVFPLVAREMRSWGRRAAGIPDPVLRRVALETQRAERGNYEGAAAFAAFVPLRRRAAVVRAVVAYQLAYDYADSLAELPAADRVANGRALHAGLHAALHPGAPQPDYYVHHDRGDDGGYLRELVEACRGAVASLPSWSTVAERARAMSRLVVEFQALNHAPAELVAGRLAELASSAPPRGAALAWWEAAAGCASSAGIFSLVAASARPSLTAREAAALEGAYVPWIGALHVLLDSLVDWPRDATVGHHSLIAHYPSRAEMARRMGALADAAMRSVQGLQRPRQHELLLAGMTGLYLVRPAAALPHAAGTTERVLGALGELVRPVMLVHRMRAAVARLTRTRRPSAAPTIQE